MSEGTAYTVPQLAKLWQVKPDYIRAFINNGRLKAFNVALKGNRCHWRVTAEAAADFVADRGNDFSRPLEKRRPRR